MSDDFKYDIVSKKHVDNKERFLDHFLSNDTKEAEQRYKEHADRLNRLAASYSRNSNVEKSDLFGSALMGLARAYRDYDSKRSPDFKSYSTYRIKDSMNKCVREFGGPVKIPAYIKLANRHIGKLKIVLTNLLISRDDIYILLESGDLNVLESLNLPEHAMYECKDLLNKISKASDRAGVDFGKLVERAEFIPFGTEYDDQAQPEESYERNQEKINAAMLVEDLKDVMDDVELYISEKIMQGNTYEEISTEFGRSPSWVCKRLASLRTKVKSLVGL